MSPRCVARVSDGRGRFSGCERKGSVENGGKLYCKQHDPAAVAARQAAADAAYKAKGEDNYRHAVAMGLACATVEQLRAELARREAKS